MAHQSSKSPRTLVLFPTSMERSRFEALGALPTELTRSAQVGFGPVAAAARTAQLLAQHEPQRVLLIGIAGSLNLERLPLATAHTFSSVALDGVGAGRGADFRSPSGLGFPQWPASKEHAAIEERLPLCLATGTEGSQLLTVCSASGTPAEAQERKLRFPLAGAEDMEGFAVALACRLKATPLLILRGISNGVGERDARAWDIQGALAAAHPLAIGLLQEAPWEQQV